VAKFEFVPAHRATSHDAGRQQAQPTGMRKWLDRLKTLQRDEAPPESLPDNVEIAEEGCAPAVEAMQAPNGEWSVFEVEWRVMALRQQIPATGPILPLVVRPDVPYLWQAPDRCAVCGNVRESSQRFICRACQRAKSRVFAAQWS